MPVTASTSGNSANNESFSKATDYLARKKYGDARRHLRKILDNDKNNARANMLLGDAYAGEGRTSDAKKYYERSNQHSSQLSAADSLRLCEKISSLNLKKSTNIPSAASAAIIDEVPNTDDEKPLFDAVDLGDSVKVKFLLSNKPHLINARTNESDGLTVLMYALQRKAFRLARELVTDYPQLLSQCNHVGENALTWAVRNKYIQLIEWLVANGANVDEVDNQDLRPIEIAVQNGDSSCVECLIGQGASINNHCSFGGLTILCIALEKKHWDIANLLFTKDPALLTLSNKNGSCPLDWAKLSPSRKEAALWLENKIAPSALSTADAACSKSSVTHNQYSLSSSNNISQIQSAISPDQLLITHLANRNRQAAKQLVSQSKNWLNGVAGDKRTPMTWAASVGDIESLKWLKAHGASISEKDSNENSPIVEAIYGNKRESAEWLVKQGVSLKDLHQRITILMYALWNEKWDMAEWLVAKDPDLFRQETADKDTPMTWAAYHGKTNIMQWLKDHGLSISKKDSNGNRPIDNAILNNQRESAEWLLNHKISLLEPFHDGASTLMLALTYDKWDMAEWLVTKNSALLRQEDACKHSPMTWAASIGKTNIMQWLKNKGVNLSEKNSAGGDAISCAKANNQSVVLDWLKDRGIRESLSAAISPDQLLITHLANRNWQAAKQLVSQSKSWLNGVAGDKRTPMTWAASVGDIESLKWLKAHGASISEKDSNENSPIVEAIYGSNRESAEWLLKEGVSLKDPHQGMTILMYALWNEKWDMAVWLVTKDPTLLRQESDGKHSPMTWAASVGKTDFMQWLKNKGVSLSEKNSVGGDALGCAKINNQPAVIDWLNNQGIRAPAVQAAQPAVSYAHNPHIFYAPSSSASRSYAPTYAYPRRDPNEEFRRDMQTAAQLVNAGAKLANGLGNLIDALDGGSQSSFFNM